MRIQATESYLPQFARISHRMSYHRAKHLAVKESGRLCEYEEYGVEDPRITNIEGTYYITYSAYSRHGVRIGLARTKGFKSLERVAFITQADYRNTVLFPEKIDGRYVKLDDPILISALGQYGLATRPTSSTGVIRRWL